MATLAQLRAELAQLEARQRNSYRNGPLTAEELRRLHILRTMVGGTSGNGSIL